MNVGSIGTQVLVLVLGALVLVAGRIVAVAFAGAAADIVDRPGRDVPGIRIIKASLDFWRRCLICGVEVRVWHLGPPSCVVGLQIPLGRQRWSPLPACVVSSVTTVVFADDADFLFCGAER